MFAVNRGQIENRIDSYSNQPKFRVALNEIKKLPIVPLSACAELIFSGITPKSGGDAYTSDGGVLFIKSGCLANDGTIAVDETSRIKDEIHNGLMKSSQLKKGDVLIAIVGATIGKVGLFSIEREANINQAIAAVRLKKGLLPEFLVAYLLSPIGQTYLEYLKRPVARANINLQEIGKIGVPLLPIEQQRRFVGMYYDALVKRQEKFKWADNMREAILTDFAESINVKIPKNKSELVAVLKMKQINATATRRLDPKCYDKKFQNIRNELNCSIHHVFQLKDLIIDNIGGDWGYNEEDESDTRIKCLVLRATEISNKDNINIRVDKAQYRQIEKKKLTAMKLEVGDIIIEKSGGSIDQPVGRVIFVDQLEYNGYPLAYSNFLTKIKINTKLVDPYYLFEYLRFIYGIGLTEVMQNQTNGIRNLIIEEFLEQTVIVPENNYEIGQRMYQLRSKARQMELDVEQEWQEAKIQFEKELLGV